MLYRQGADVDTIHAFIQSHKEMIASLPTLAVINSAFKAYRGF